MGLKMANTLKNTKIIKSTKMSVVQNKQKEIEFFDNFSQLEYNVFTDKANQKIIDTVLQLGKFPSNGLLADLGCGSGVFTDLMCARGFDVMGVDLSFTLTKYAKNNTKHVFFQGDVEYLPFKDNSLDGIILSALIHHLPEINHCMNEVMRVLKPGARFVAFDPNRLNPFMYLYRDKSSPFYSNKGVTENERPILHKPLCKTYQDIGFSDVGASFVSGLSYRYIASPMMRRILPIYNWIDSLMFKPSFLKKHRVFVFTHGKKPL
jgi:ubiquinone/menaquinone biosynthesis C-methylase UbiE